MADLIFPTNIPSKANPVDWDILLIADSADSNEMKQITIGSITWDIADWIINDSSASSTTTYSSTKIATEITNATPDSSTTVKGLTKMSVAPASASSPIAVGDNDWRVPTQGENDALVGNNLDIAVGTGNKFITQTWLQHNAEKYAADSGSNDTYVITLSPAPTSYTNGMVVYFKANTVNTWAATINVNSLGAKTIVKGVNTTLADGDIAAWQLCTLIYDWTNFVLQTPTANVSWVFSYASAPVDTTPLNTTQNVDTTFTPWFTAKNITVYYKIMGTESSAARYSYGHATYNWTTLQSNYILKSNAATDSITWGVLTINTTSPTAGTNAANGTLVVMSVTSVTSTQFTVRVALTVNNSTNWQAIFYVVATQ